MKIKLLVPKGPFLQLLKIVLIWLCWASLFWLMAAEEGLL